MKPERQAKIERVLNLRQPDIAVLLENVTDPHNISAVMRTCDAIGIQEIYILTNRINKHKKFGNKTSAGANTWLTIKQYEDTEECLKDIKAKYNKIYATHLGAKSVSLYELDLTQSVVLAFGNEHAGLTEETLTHCDGNFIIPQVGMVQSLNISVACAVTLYEAFRQKKVAGHYDCGTRMDKDQAKELATEWGWYENSF